jgi:ferredoxin
MQAADLLRNAARRSKGVGMTRTAASETVRSAGEAIMRIRIEKSACVGNARCAAVAGDLYPLDDDGYIAVDQIDVPAGEEQLARRGARACPERIIFVEDDE